MPKYFSGLRPLPFQRIDWSTNDISYEAVRTIFSETQSASFCIRLPGLPDSCLGYVVNIKHTDDRLDVFDISGKLLISLEGYDEVVSMLHHAAGTRVNDSIRERLLRVRDVSS